MNIKPQFLKNPTLFIFQIHSADVLVFPFFTELQTNKGPVFRKISKISPREHDDHHGTGHTQLSINVFRKLLCILNK